MHLQPTLVRAAVRPLLTNGVARRRRRAGPLLAAAGLVAGLAVAAQAQVETHWANPVSGDWTDPALWSGGVAPDNNSHPGTTYRVLIDATGQAYTISLASAATIDDLVMTSADATLLLNAGALLTSLNLIDLSAGVLRLDGGTVANSTINMNGGVLFFTSSLGNTFDAVTVNGDFNLADPYSTLAITNGLSLNGTCRISGNHSELNFFGTQSLETGTILFNTSLGFDTANLGVDGFSTFTIGAAATIRGGNGVIGHQTSEGSSNTVINDGLISADRAGASLSISSGFFINNATIETRNAGTLSINADAWQNVGTIVVDNGTLNLGGTFGFADIGTIQRTGGAINITGTLDNTGNTLLLDASTGSWRLNGGTIHAGTLAFADNEQLLVSSHVDNTLDAVSVSGDLSLTEPNARLKIVNGLSLDGTVHLAGSQAQLGFSDTTTLLSGTISFEGTEGNPRRVAADFDQTLTLGPDVLLIASGGARGNVGHGVLNEDNITIINQGTATATGAGSRIDFIPTSFVNEGVLNAIDGGTISLGPSLSPNGTWSNPGIINVNGGTLLLGGNTTPGGLGTINATSGSIFVTGNLDATDSTITTLPGVTFGLRSGGIINGTIVTAPSSPLVIEQENVSLTPYLRNVTILGDAAVNTPNVSFAIDDALTLDGNFRFNSTGTTIYCNNDQTINGGTLAFNAPSGITLWRVDSNKTLTLGASTTVRGGRLEISPSGYDTTLVNNGHIIADTLGAAISLGTQNVVNNGTIDVAGGMLTFGAAIGTTNAGVVNVSAGTLTIGNPFTQATGGVINQTGGLVRLTGVLNNNGATLDLNGPTAVWSLEQGNTQGGGVVNGGSILVRNGAFLNVARGVFRNVSLDGSISIAGSTSRLVVDNSLALNGEIQLRQDAQLNFESSADTTTILTGGSILLNNGPSSPRDILNVRFGQTLTLSPTSVVHGGNAMVARPLQPNASTRLINEGRITADVANQRLSLQPSVFENRGLAEAINGADLEIAYQTSMINTGLLRAGPGSHIVFGGRTTTTDLGAYDATAGTFYFTGLLDNTGSVFNVASNAGTFSMTAGGAIKGGTVNVVDDGALVVTNGTGVLDETSVQGNIIATDFGRVEIRNGISLDGDIRLRGTQSLVRFASTSTLDSGRILFDPSGGGDERGIYTNQGQTTTLGANASIEGGRGVVFTSNSSGVESAFINQGLIHANISAERIRIYAARFLNQGTLQASNGGLIVFEPPGLAPEDHLTLMSTGLLDIAAGSSLQLDGSLVETAQATLRIAIRDNELAITPLVISDLLSLDGSLVVTLADGAPSPVYGEWFRLLSAGRLDGAFSSIDLPALGADLHWDTGRLYVDGSIQVIPAPAASIPILAGLLLQGLARRRNAPSRRHAQ